MRYLAILRYGPGVAELEEGTPEFQADLERYERFDDIAGERIVGGAALDHSRTAVTVRPGDTAPLVTDGPFTETTEVVGGFYVLEAATLDEAVDLARHNPTAEDGSIELRPMAEWWERPAPEGATSWLALLYAGQTDAEVPGTAAWAEGVAQHRRFGDEAGDAVLAGGALHPATTATTVRVRDGEVLLTDGPFAETAEVVGGLYALAAPDRDTAVALAARIPVAMSGGVEVRPILTFD